MGSGHPRLLEIILLVDYMTVAIHACGKWEGEREDAYKILPAWSFPAVVEAGLPLAGQRLSTPGRYFSSGKGRGWGC